MKAIEEYEKTFQDAVQAYMKENLPALFDISSEAEGHLLIEAYFSNEDQLLEYRRQVNSALWIEMSDDYNKDISSLGRSTEHRQDTEQVVVNLVIAKVRLYDAMWQSLVKNHEDLLPNLFKEQIKGCFLRSNLPYLRSAAKYL